MHRMIARICFLTGWTREYVLDHLTLAQVFRYFEYGMEYMADMAQMVAMEVGLVNGFIKPKNPHKDVGVGSVPAQNQPDVAGDGIQELILANLGGQKKPCL